MVKTIKIGSMGQSDEAERFRLLLDEELGKAGFSTTEDDTAADAILTGALSVRVYNNTSKARVSVQLKTPSGKRLWGKDFEPHFNIRGTETVRLRAQDIAKALAKEAKKTR
jgi:hypothetical protein